MIYINKNTENRIALTLSESTEKPNFLFQFVNEYDKTITYFTTPDISTATNRYNLFVITDSDSGSIVGGNNIPLNFTSGQYKYTIYATDIIINITNINLDDYDKIETGILFVNGINETIDPRYN